MSGEPTPPQPQPSASAPAVRWLTAGLLLVSAILVALLLLSRARAGEVSGTAIETRPTPAREATFITHTEAEHRLSDSAGKLRLVFFGFTRCPDVCPGTMQVLTQDVQALSAEQQEQVQVYLITVDPDFDTPERLGAYLDSFSPAFLGLTAEPETLAQAQAEFFVASHQTDPGQFFHTDMVIVLDGSGRMRYIYNQMQLMGGELSKDLPALLRLAKD